MQLKLIMIIILNYVHLARNKAGMFNTKQRLTFFAVSCSCTVLTPVVDSLDDPKVSFQQTPGIVGDMRFNLHCHFELENDIKFKA